MTLRRRILAAIGLFFALVIVSAAVALSYNAPCRAPEPLPPGVERMKAIVARCYGTPDVLRLEEVARPVPADNELLVKVHAAALNPVDWHYLRGKPYLIRLPSDVGAPENPAVGQDFAGIVAAVGRSVTRFKAGDEVFGSRTGALAQYVRVREDRSVIPKPANVSFEEAASVGVAAITALQGLRDIGELRAGQKVLINGASGGVGTFAVQVAKSLGAEVTAVCSTRNVELVRSLGADHVVDYTKEDFAERATQYDMILDNVGNRALSAYRRVLKPQGTLVIVGGGGPEEDPWIGPLALPIKAALLSPFVSQKMSMMYAQMNPADLRVIADLMATGQVKAIIDRRYPLSDTAAAMTYLETGRARGKVVVTVAQD